MTAHEIWMEYDSTILEWGLPEKTLEAEMERRGLTGRIVGSGTDLGSGKRDVQVVVNGSLEQVAAVMGFVSADGMVSCRLLEEES